MKSPVTGIPLTGTALAPAACGELVEGAMGPDANQDFLVSCPIALYNKATVHLYPKRELKGMDPYPSGHSKRSKAHPRGYPKAYRAINIALKAWWPQNEWEPILEIESNIPLGKGMASSTADIGAALAATALALGQTPDPLEITKLAVQVEPTDSTLFPQLTVFDHIKGNLHVPLGTPPPLMIMAFDWGGQIASDNWYRAGYSLLPRSKHQSSLAIEALELIRKGLVQQEAKILAAGATLSAFAHQSILHKEGLRELTRCASRQGALGVTVAHSGTVAGLIFPPVEAEYATAVAQELNQAFPNLRYLGTYRFIGGGIRW
ncbi:MAG: hypothetical protein GX986_09735 [Firmicutes bacterium]|nr:hypothetical protein [Bacillota bacterium]